MRTFFLCLIGLNFLCFTGRGQIPGQAKPTHDQYGAISTDHQGLIFEVIKPFRLVSVDAWSAGSGGALFIELHDSTTGTVLNTTRVAVPGGGTIRKPVRFSIPLHWTIPPGKYLLVAYGGPLLMYDHLPTTGGAYSYPLGTIGKVVAGYTPTGNTDINYYFFYNWTIEY